jgi:protein-disulfide isomerase
MKWIATVLVALLPCVAASLDAHKGKALGNPSAPVHIVIYSDYECPACKGFHEQVLPMMMRDYVVPGKVYIVSREFPLPMHQYSREAANYAVAAARIGKYTDVADALFQSQAAWSVNGKVWETVAGVLTAAEQKKVQALAKDAAVMAEVQADVTGAQNDKINQTPTVIVERGARHYAFPGPTPANYTLLRSLIDGLLK